jgi:anaerobic ribonucleoside-triphosphate reductase activating protein
MSYHQNGLRSGSMNIRLHAFEPFSRSNGPGLRAVVWFQGCTLNCLGCFNPATHDPAGGYAYDTEKLAADILDLGDKIEGVSISGGEPLQQPQALLDLLERLAASSLSTLLFSGYTLSEIAVKPLGAEILGHIDVLIAGRFDDSTPCGKGLSGSANQQVHFLTSRYAGVDLAKVPPRELIIHKDGSLTGSGIRPWRP